MKIRKDEIGNHYGKLTVIAFDHQGSNRMNYWKCKCECGNETVVRIDNLHNGHTTSCGCVKSQGEEKIIKILKELNYSFDTQYIFSDLFDVHHLQFDFCIIKNNIPYLIEYDGSQHFYSCNRWWNTEDYLKNLQYHDKMKDDYCKKHQYPLLRLNFKMEDVELRTRIQQFLS